MIMKNTGQSSSMFYRLLGVLFIMDVVLVGINVIMQLSRPIATPILLVAFAIVQLMLLFAITLWAGYQYGIRPLMTVIRSIQDLELSDPSNPQPQIKPKINNFTEINLLISVVNNILDNLSTTKSNLLTMQERLMGIISAMPSVIIGVDKEGRITDWNAQAEEVTKLTAAEVHGQLLTEVYPDYQNYLELAKLAINKNQLQKHTKHLREVAKENKYFDIIVYPVINNNYKGAVIRIDDVTTQVLLEDIMVQTEKMSSLGGLAAGVAHEINNPLGAIVQSGQNILRRLDPNMPKNIALAKTLNVDLEALQSYMVASRIIDFIQGIREAGNRAANIVSNLLQFARTSNTQKAMHSVVQIVENAIELASTDYNTQKKTDFRHIKIIKDYSNNLPSIYCCAMEIEQVILNILKNAAYALALGTKTPVITIKIWAEVEMLAIEIHDNGPGMSEAIKKKIFDPFFTTKPQGEGTGLGLSVSFNIIVDRHGGSFAVESSETTGTKFIIVLPIISLNSKNLKEYMQALTVT